MSNRDLLVGLAVQLKMQFEELGRLEGEIKNNLARLGYEC